jgi:fumarate hydratase subunit beta
MAVIRVNTPLTEEVVTELKSGDKILINGIIYTARDAAHKRLIELIDNEKELPFDVNGQIIYYVGPTPARPGNIIGSAGPTTSYRMDSYSPKLIEKGLKGMIGKGPRSREVIESMKKFNCLYMAAVGGAGALISKCIKSSKVIAYEDLGTEAIRQMEVLDFPVIIVNDTLGNDLYQEGVNQYRINE